MKREDFLGQEPKRADILELLDERQEMMFAAATVFSALVGFAAAAPQQPQQPLAAPVVTPLFVPTARYPCFRQPAIITAGDTILAFAENRNVSACAPELGLETAAEETAPGSLDAPMETGSMQLRRSTDGGKSWLPMQALTTGSIDFYSVVYDAKSHTVWLMVAQHGTSVYSSSDAGATWKTMPPLDPEGIGKPPIRVTGPAVGHGIQIEPALCTPACKDAGRLLLPFVCTNTSANGTHGDRGCTTCNACLLVSDDAGKTWELGAIGQQGTRESQAVQVPSTTASASIYASERNMGAHPGHRQWGLSADAGSTYATTGTDSTLTAPVTAVSNPHLMRIHDPHLNLPSSSPHPHLILASSSPHPHPILTSSSPHPVTALDRYRRRAPVCQRGQAPRLQVIPEPFYSDHSPFESDHSPFRATTL